MRAVATITGLSLISALGWAGPRGEARLAVVPIVVDGDYGSTTVNAIFDAVAEAAAMRHHLSLISNEEMFVRLGQLTDRIRDCGSDIPCIAGRLRIVDAQMGLIVVANFAIDPPLISLQLVDIDGATMIADSPGALTAEERSVTGAIKERAQRIFDDAGFVVAGRIVVVADPPRAMISLGDGVEPDKGTPNVFTVVPGPFVVKANLEGHAPAEVRVEVKSGETLRVPLALEAESSIVESPWFWVVLGAVVAGGATATAIALQPTTRCLCVTLNGAGCEACRE